jgi:hypothetical protein
MPDAKSFKKGKLAERREFEKFVKDQNINLPKLKKLVSDGAVTPEQIQKMTFDIYDQNLTIEEAQKYLAQLGIYKKIPPKNIN